MKKVNSLVMGMAATMFAVGANASSVFVNPDQISAVAGETFIANIQADFSDSGVGVDTGGFLLTWDTSVLTLVGGGQSQALTQAFADFTTNNSIGFNIATAWGGTTIFDPVIGSLDFSFSNCGDVGGFFACDSIGTNFNVFDLEFQVNDDVVGTSEAGLSIGVFGSIWTGASGLQLLSPDFQGASITVSAVPVPSAVWLLGTAMIGLVGMGRERKIEAA